MHESEKINIIVVALSFLIFGSAIAVKMAKIVMINCTNHQTPKLEKIKNELLTRLVFSSKQNGMHSADMPR